MEMMGFIDPMTSLQLGISDELISQSSSEVEQKSTPVWDSPEDSIVRINFGNDKSSADTLFSSENSDTNNESADMEFNFSTPLLYATQNYLMLARKLPINEYRRGFKDLYSMSALALFVSAFSKAKRVSSAYLPFPTFLLKMASAGLSRMGVSCCAPSDKDWDISSLQVFAYFH